MSTNCSFSGISIKIAEDKKDKESLIDIAKYLHYDEKKLEVFNDEYYPYELNYIADNSKWSLYSDSNGTVGIVYIVDDEADAFDIEFTLSLEKVNSILGELFNMLPKHYLDISASNVNIFAHIYYNGSDSPFKF